VDSFEIQPPRTDPAANRVGDEPRRERFRWQAAELAGLPGGGLNIAYEAIDRHAIGPRSAKVVLRWHTKQGTRPEVTYAELAAETSRFANALIALGIEPRDVVVTLCGRSPELYTAVFGALKRGCVVCPLYSSFGPDPIITRVTSVKARVLVTTASLYRRKIAVIRDRMPSVAWVIIIDEQNPEPVDDPGTVHWRDVVDVASSDFQIPYTDPHQLALIHFTSGTTDRPKGAMHVHEAVLAQCATARTFLDLHEDDVFWCTADPGWITGISYGLIAPLVLGVTSVVDEEEFLATRWYHILEEEHVSVWYTAPTSLRMLMKAGLDLPPRFDLSALRLVASVGEPLDPAAVAWGRQAFGAPIHDSWWQTETGAVMIANLPGDELRPGSMGKPLPGIEAAIVEVTAGHVTEQPTGAIGELALRAGWPSMFRGYMNDDERYRQCFADGWYLTGDLARRDPDGYYWFIGRREDLIDSAGQVFGPFAVESVLVTHPAIAHAAVIGIPHPIAGSIVKAFVVVRPHHGADPALRDDILALTRRTLDPAMVPSELVFVPDLPRTRSGKIMRRLLRAHELGLPEGDTSTLEGTR